MSMGVEVGVFLAYASAVILVYVLGRFLLAPLKMMIYCIVNSLAGGAAILLINFFFTSWGMFIPVNVFTAMIAGFLGVPGLILMVVFFI